MALFETRGTRPLYKGALNTVKRPFLAISKEGELIRESARAAVASAVEVSRDAIFDNR